MYRGVHAFQRFIYQPRLALRTTNITLSDEACDRIGTTIIISILRPAPELCT